MNGPFEGKSVNLFWVRALTRDAIDALEGILRDADAGELDEDGHVVLTVHLEEALRHICEIWNLKWLRNDYPESQQLRDRAATAIPNFGERFSLVKEWADIGLDQRD